MFSDPFSGKQFADGVRRFLGDLGLCPEDAEMVIDSGGGPGIVYEAFVSFLSHLREVGGSHEELARILPAPFSDVPFTRRQTERFLLNRGLTPPPADTPAGFFNKLRCEAQLNKVLEGRVGQCSSIDTPGVLMAVAIV